MHFAVLVIGEDYEAALAPFNSDTEEDNGQGRWDWYVLGGRYLGRLLVKQGALAASGRPGTGNNDPLYPEGVDQARFGDLDWARMREAARATAEESYKRLIDPNHPDAIWYSEKDRVEARADPEKWINSHSTPLSCFGVVKDGKWYDRYRREGEYTEEGGWPDNYFADKSDEEWHAELGALLADIQPDTVISFVDCHD